MIFPTATNDNAVGGGPYATPGVFAPAMFIQFAGFTWGKTASFFDFDLQPYSNQTNFWGSNQAINTGQQIFGYTAQFGNGFSASISGEDPTSRRSSIARQLLLSGGAPQCCLRRPSLAGCGRQPARRPGVGQRTDHGRRPRRLRLLVTAGAPDPTASATGWAVGGGVKFLLPMIGKNDYVIAQVAYGEGATNYIGSSLGAGGLGAELLQTGFPVVTNTAIGPVFDGVVAGGGAGGTGYRPDLGLERHCRLRALVGANLEDLALRRLRSAQVQPECQHLPRACSWYRCRSGGDRECKLVVLADRLQDGLDAGSQPRSERRNHVQQAGRGLRRP